MIYKFPIEIVRLFHLLIHFFQLEKRQAQAATGQIEWMDAFPLRSFFGTHDFDTFDFRLCL